MIPKRKCQKPLFCKTNSHSQRSNSSKKLKLLKLIEGVVGFFFVTFVTYLDCDNGVRYFSKTDSFSWSLLRGSLSDHQRTDFLEQECDVFDGQWLWDETYPLYKSRDCSFLDEGFRCNENGRPDYFYTKWRWKPKHCNLPRFDAKTMLEKLRNRRVVFIGDSIGRNQWESLLCLLSSVIPNKESIYEVNGSTITKHKGFLVFKFEDYNCTVEYYKSSFLVLQTRPPPGTL
ncbi:Trichome birefringence-like, N-terminal domain [Dillenia turbinata]|uniref:Trichome birefringence-like, N-terminal domain n=1 Tax=Dillenia turbinata TaxID=194707 RepID=A0AAN8Z9I8_9MAGN